MASHEQEDTMPEETQGYKLSQPKQSLAEYQKMGTEYVQNTIMSSKLGKTTQDRSSSCLSSYCQHLTTHPSPSHHSHQTCFSSPVASFTFVFG
ncbi:RHO protein GDP dissociation inhibitor [Colletotrichum chrysophilum]|uniref:RHO protein GDP dissociation inhibitor n=1 Tax=Colletotrichum chrysophilum TaxID=1836956 RepID=A0AAD9A567_9PEZI|nr:RHO protein GDP dissociation inhibitor [Colletotrichum chrysophilum]